MSLIGPLCIVIASTIFITRRQIVYWLHLFGDEKGNESLYLDADFDGKKTFFLIDTAYAGAPVLSLSYLSKLQMHKRYLTRGSVKKRFAYTMELLREQTSDKLMHESLRRFSDTSRCRSFTSGCTMRLMGIGTTNEARSDMFLCPPLKLKGPNLIPKGWDADVFVTNPLHGSTHIITADYLLHRSPAVIQISKGRLLLNARNHPTHRYDKFPAEMAGGAFIVPIKIGGEILKVVVDTGASVAISLGKESGKKIKDCKATNRNLHQGGVNGEKICSDIIVTTVQLGKEVFENIQLVVNSMDVSGADGYMGMGLLRAFDLYIDRDVIGFKRNGMKVHDIRSFTEGKCKTSSVQCKK